MHDEMARAARGCMMRAVRAARAAATMREGGGDGKGCMTMAVRVARAAATRMHDEGSEEMYEKVNAQ